MALSREIARYLKFWAIARCRQAALFASEPPATCARISTHHGQSNSRFGICRLFFHFFFSHTKNIFVLRTNYQLSFSYTTMASAMEEDYDESMQESQMQFSTASTTIDASVVQSRIRQSASLRNEDTSMVDNSEQPVFPKLSAAQAAGNKVEYRRIRCPAHRYTPLREHWEQILTPLVEYLKLQVRPPIPDQFWKRQEMRGKIYPFDSERSLCCSWNFKPSGKPQWIKEWNGTTRS